MNEIIIHQQENAIEILVGQPLDQNPAAVYLASLGKNTRRVAKQALDVIARMVIPGCPDCLSFPWGKLRYQHTSAIRAQLAERYTPGTANRMLCALRKTIKEAWRLDQIAEKDLGKAIDLKPIVGQTLPAGRGLSSGEITALMQNCETESTAAGVRDEAVVALMYTCGLRRDEVVHLDRENYDPETGELKILIAKRNKQRMAYLVNGAASAMADWLAVRGNEPGPLFYAVNKGGRVVVGRMTAQAIYNILAKRARLAGVNKFTPHDLRRTFVSDLLDAGADINTVSKMAGHASVVTTGRYDRRPEEAKRKTAGLLHVPYHRRAE